MAGNFELKALWLCKFLGRNSERCGNFVWKTSFYYHSWKWKITEFKINQFPAITSMTRVIHTQKKIQTSQKLQNANSSYNRFQSKYFHRTHHPFHTLPGMLRLVEAIVDGKPQRLHFISGAIVGIKCVLLIFATAHISLHLHIHVTFYIYLKTFPKKNHHARQMVSMNHRFGERKKTRWKSCAAVLRASLETILWGVVFQRESSPQIKIMDERQDHKPCKDMHMLNPQRR